MSQKLQQFSDLKQAMPAEQKTHEQSKLEKMLVLDTSAVPSENSPTGERSHAQIINGITKIFRFLPGVGTPMEPSIAAKFLRHEAFRLVDADGNELPYERVPKQPTDLQAGEKLVLADNETVARYDELTNAALLQRVLPLPGGEKFSADAPDRKAVIDFIIAAQQKLAAAKRSRVRDVGNDEFVPAADFDEVA